ncbi:MAG: DUF2961 domain-containing protein [Candidatus Hydrogenedentes bacterium]|nr:DUF2961 domain-containing protein [Candidatus Hydrogenedentota bacterium]
MRNLLYAVLTGVAIVAFADDRSDIIIADAGALGNLTQVQAYEARRASSSHVEIHSNGDARPIEAGATLVLMDEQGPGIITHFWNTVGAYDPYYARSLVLRVYYDGLEEPSVEAPLGDFFGVGNAMERQFTSQPVATSSNGRSRACYWQMPFRESIKVTVTNDNTEMRVDSFYYYLSWRKLESLPEDTLYFHARYRQEYPAKPGNYRILQTEGKGHYVGTVLSALQMETGWFGEGDDFFYIDGAELPQLRGTGTEDYFNDSWGFREFSTPYYGVPVYEGVLAGDRVSAYRWHITDPIPFTTALRTEIEHRGSIFNDQAPLMQIEVGGFIERYDWVSSVAFWYQYPPVFSPEPFPSRAERVPPATMLMAASMTYTADPPLLVVPMEPAVLYVPGIDKGRIDFDFEVPEDGRYRLDGIFMYSLFCGVYQPLLDGEPVGQPVDFGARGMDPVWLPLDIHLLKAGKHTVGFAGSGESSKFKRALAPAEGGIAVVGFQLMRLDTLDGYQQALKLELEKRAAKGK